MFEVCSICDTRVKARKHQNTPTGRLDTRQTDTFLHDLVTLWRPDARAAHKRLPSPLVIASFPAVMAGTLQGG